MEGLVPAKMFTMKDLSDKQKGPWLYTLLDGKALEAVEDLSFEGLMEGSGHQLLLDALTRRFPEKEPHDLMGEALGEVFGLSASEGENVQQWTARVQEVFLKCTRRANVTFPAQAQGWIALNCAGFNEEQRAIIKAKARGSLAIDDVTAAMRSCFPGYKASSRGKKPLSALAVEPGTGAKQLESSTEELPGCGSLFGGSRTDCRGACDEAPIPESEAAEA